MVGRLNSLSQRLRAPSQNRQFMMKLTMFDQHSFNSCSKDLDSLARERSRIDQIGVNMGGKLVCRTNAHCMDSTLAHLSKNKTEVANRVLNSPLKILKMTTSKLDASEGHKETEDVVGALEDSEDP